MNTRERFLGVLNYQKVDRVPDMELGFWEGTIERWHSEGLPDDVTLETVDDFFGFEKRDSLDVDTGPIPTLAVDFIEEQGDYIIFKDNFGCTCRKPKHGHTIPEYLRHAIEKNGDWEDIKRRFDASLPGRYPKNWEERKKQFRERQVPLGVHFVSLFGWLRSYMGAEECCVKFALDRDFIEEIQEHLTNFYLELMEPVLKEIGGVDYAMVWEDMCYNKGPLISPKMYAETAIRRYKRIISMFHDYGTELVFVDSDGKIDELVPVWLEAGINVHYPIEAAHTKAEPLRAKYGREMRMLGGVNKIALAKGKKEIDAELARVEKLMRQGGYIPTLDHAVPEDVPYENYCYYLEKKREMLRRVPPKWEL